MDRLTATKELLDRCIQRPNERYAYSRCEVCGTAFWGREEHCFGCKLLEWREALRDQSLSQEAVRDEVLAALEEAARRYPNNAAVAFLFGAIGPTGTITAAELAALKREPNAAAESYEAAHPKALDEPAPAAPDVASMVKLLRERAKFLDDIGHEGAVNDAIIMAQAAALLTKLGQGWIPVAWRLVNKNGQHIQWAKTYSFDPSEGGNDAERIAADQKHLDGFPHNWQPLYARVPGASDE